MASSIDSWCPPYASDAEDSSLREPITLWTAAGHKINRWFEWNGEPTQGDTCLCNASVYDKGILQIMLNNMYYMYGSSLGEPYMQY